MGLFANEHLRDKGTPDNHPSEPTLKEMLKFSLERAKAAIDNQCRGSFIMVEGSQVDWAGHANNIDYLERELGEFDEATRYALDYAKNNQNTLVVVTADHETGGMGINKGSIRTFKFEAQYTTLGHTATMVPVFSYGPFSEKFSGIYDNTEIFQKMVESINGP